MCLDAAQVGGAACGVESGHRLFQVLGPVQAEGGALSRGEVAAEFVVGACQLVGHLQALGRADGPGPRPPGGAGRGRRARRASRRQMSALGRAMGNVRA